VTEKGREAREGMEVPKLSVVTASDAEALVAFASRL
jgi:hypothetical protein